MQPTADIVSKKPSPTGDVARIESCHEGNMRTYGHEEADAHGHTPVLRKDFSTLASLGLGFGITNSWIGYAASFGTNLTYGGPSNAVFGLLIATFIQYFITLGLSEIASALPSSGGQYHAVWLLATPNTRRFLAFIVGWWSVIGWWVLTCSGISLATLSVSGMVQFWFPGFDSHPWNLYLIYLAVIALTAAPIYLSHKVEPILTKIGLCCSIVNAAVTLIVLLSMKTQTRSASFVFNSRPGTSGWGEDFAWVLGIGNSMYAYVATDAAMHIAEEMRHPGSKIPFILNTTIALGFLTAFPLILVMMFTISDLDAVMASPLPSLECYYQATGSKVAATGLQVILTICFICAPFAEWITCSRQVWAFSRDNGFPFSQYFSHIDQKKRTPVRALLVSILFCALYGLLYLASSTAFNSIVTSAVIYLNLSYLVPQGILLFRGRHILPARALNLGPLGYFCNAFTVIVVPILSVILCFPPILPATVGAMNYTAPVLFGIMAIIVVLWFVMGHKFQGPDVEMDSVGALASEALSSKRTFLGVTWRFKVD